MHGGEDVMHVAKTTLGCRSGWFQAMPESMTATTVRCDPVNPALQARSARTRFTPKLPAVVQVFCGCGSVQCVARNGRGDLVDRDAPDGLNGEAGHRGQGAHETRVRGQGNGHPDLGEPADEASSTLLNRFGELRRKPVTGHVDHVSDGPGIRAKYEEDPCADRQCDQGDEQGSVHTRARESNGVGRDSPITSPSTTARAVS